MPIPSDPKRRAGTVYRPSSPAKELIMPCMDSSGEITAAARKILAAMGEGAPLSEVAEKTGLPLYRIRSAARELAEAGLAQEKNETYAATEAGRAALATPSRGA